MSKNRNLIFIIYLLFTGFFLSCSSGGIGLEVEEETKDTPDESVGEEEEDENLPEPPPETWREHWFDHNQVVELVYYDEDVAVYFDDDVDPGIKWPNTYLSQVWSYIKEVYGEFGDDPKLYTIFHTDKYSGGHPSVYMDESHDYRNVVDCGPYTWKEMKPEAGLSMVIHEVGHIVEGAANGIKHNPAWDIWKDSKWAEIFIYDVYKNTGREDFAQQTYDDMMDQYDDFPRRNTQWFKNWFYPIYSQYGESSVLNGFYDLLALYFPRNSTGDAFARRMNMGEFVHFWSGSAGTNLQPLAKEAFGWSSEWQDQFAEAQRNFNRLNY